MTPWLAVVGIGDDGMDGLTAAGRTLVETAEVLVGGARHLEMAPETAAERLLWGLPIGQTISAIESRRGRRVTVLASGDPMWYGIGVTLACRFPRKEMTILPQPSAFSLVAARLGWALADCATISLHGRPLDTLRLHLAPERRVLILSEGGRTPSAVADLLTKLGWGPSQLIVFAHLQGRNEGVFSQEARFWGERRVPDLNTIALACRADPGARAFPLLAGLPDEAFEHDGQLTKREVRAATLAALSPLPGQVLWDIGAGCGSISIEWLRAGGGCSAIAIERDPARAALVARNASSLGVPALRVVVGAAPGALGDLPQPNAIFIGGGVGETGLLQQAWGALLAGGRLVANVVTTEGEARLLDWHARHGGALTRISVSRAVPRSPHHLWRPSATVTQLAAVKPV